MNRLDKLQTILNGLAASFYTPERALGEIRRQGFETRFHPYQVSDPWSDSMVMLQVVHPSDTALDVSTKPMAKVQGYDEPDFVRTSMALREELECLLERLIELEKAYTESDSLVFIDAEERNAHVDPVMRDVLNAFRF